MTTTTSTSTYTQPFDALSSSPAFSFSSPAPFSTSFRPSPRPLSRSSHAAPHNAEINMENMPKIRKRYFEAKDGRQASMDSTGVAQEADESQVTQATWLKRLSAFSSDQGSLPSSPRPPSTAVSQSNGSVAFSNAGSTTPMFPSFAPAPAPPNKLVKRSSSIRESKPDSRIPIPNFKRPATSHERDLALQGLQTRPSTATSSLCHPDSPAPESSSGSWKTYFTPKIALETSPVSSRRSSTSIPNPIKRIVPDRRYHPVLVSAAETIRLAAVELEEGESHEPTPVITRSRGSVRVSRRFFSAPLPQRLSTTSSNASPAASQHLQVDDSVATSSSVGGSSKRNSQISSDKLDVPRGSPLLSVTRRSFSPAGLIPTELPKWKRPAKNKAVDPKSRRKSIRSVSEPETAIVAQPKTQQGVLERPSKRRDTSGLSRHSSDNYHELPGKAAAPSTAASSVRSNGRTKTLRAFGTDDSSSNPRHSWVEHGAFPTESAQVSSPGGFSNKSKPSRQSAALSEFASTFTGSDSDARFNDDDGFESPNDTLFDSVRTRATSASSTGIKGPRIDALFEESTTKYETTTTTASASDNFFHVSKYANAFDRPRHSVIEEEESVSTPVKPQRNGSAQPSPETFRLASPPAYPINSSPPELTPAFRRTASDHVGLGLDDDEEDGMWDFGDQADLPTWPLNGQFQSSTLPGLLLHPNLKSTALSMTPHKNYSDQTHDARSNIFDWSEQQVKDKSPAGNRSPPRPRTVHGKKDAENRGSRSVGRRAPSTLHIRSQSVPVAPELDGKRSLVVTNKFGTWGVGSKGVSEDWNEDFDFEEAVPPVPDLPTALPLPEDKQRDVSGGMRVPQAIQQQQQNVLANINLLRDWGLLIEELKELRDKASSLRLVDGLKEPMWHEVDAMVDLADQESNDQTLAPRQSPPSSPTFDYSAFDEIPVRSSPRPAPKKHAEDIFESPTPSPVRKGLDKENLPSPRRPRKDSEAVARCVIEALQQRRDILDPTQGGSSATKKVPFDTATLKRIVPYVQELRDRVKRSVQEAENLPASPPSMFTGGDPSFSKIFHDPPESPTVLRTTRRGSSAQNKEHMTNEGSSSRSPPDELSRRLELMTMG